MTVIEQRDAPASTAERAPRGRRLKSLLGWAIIVALVLGGVFVATQVAVRMPDQRGSLDPESVSDSGAMALAQILEEQGVEVSVFRSRAEARAALDENSTLVMANPYTLSDDGITELIAPADRVVFLSSSTHLLNLLRMGENAASDPSPVEADCSAAEFADVGTILPDRMFAPADGVEGCFGTDDASAVLVDEDDGATRIVVEGARLFSNAYLADDGNSAL